MSKSSPPVCFALVAALFAIPATATPVFYTINFTLNSGTTLPTAGSFTYDAATPLFTGFLVTAGGVTFDLTSAANAPSNLGASPCNVAGPTTGFNLMAGACVGTRVWVFSNPATALIFQFQTPTGQPVIGAALGSTTVGPSSDGSWTITAAGVPEPASLSLFLAGALALLGMKRIRRT